jgi:hypothetical protein
VTLALYAFSTEQIQEGGVDNWLRDSYFPPSYLALLPSVKVRITKPATVLLYIYHTMKREWLVDLRRYITTYSP